MKNSAPLISSCLVAGLLLLQGLPAQAQGEKEALHRRADLSRPLDLVRLDPRWNLASPDLFSGWMDSGLYGFYGPQPRLMMDSLPLPPPILGWQNLNMLPLSLDAIDRTESSFRPGIVHGSRIRSGHLNIVTAMPDSGWSAGADFYLGNESGDPGPWIYDSTRVTPNVDRWGPDGSMHLAWSGSRWRFIAMGSHREHQPTDLISMRRLNNQLYIPETETFHPIKITSRGLLLQAGYRGERLQATLRGIAARSEDFLFLQPFGREVPANNEYRQFSAAVSYDAGAWQYKGSYSYDEKAAAYRTNIREYDLGWSLNSHEASLSAVRLGEGYRLEPGLIVGRTVNESERLEENAPASTGLLSLYLKGEADLGRSPAGLYYRADVDLGEGSEALGLSLGTRLLQRQDGERTVRRNRLDANIFYEELLPQEANSFVWWQSSGYRFPADDPLPAPGPQEPVKNRLTGIFLEHAYRLSPHLAATLEHRFIRHHILGIPWQQVEPDESYTARPGLFTYSAESGSRLLNTGILTHRQGPWKQELTVLLQHTLDGSTRYHRYWDQVPAFRMRYELQWDATPGTRLMLQARFRGNSRWHEYASLDGEEYRSLVPFYPYQTGIFRTETPSWVDLGFSARKWFWERRLSLQLSLRNLLNREIRMHTIGASRSTLLHIRASFNLR